MTRKLPADEVEVKRCVVMIATRLNGQVSEISRSLWRTLEDQIAELRGDARMTAMLRASVKGNVETVLRALRDDMPVEQTAVPTAAFEHAKRLAQHGVPVNALVRAYRLAQRWMTELVFAELRALEIEPATQVGVIEVVTTVVFEYVDWVSQQVVTTYEGEHERWHEHQNSIRAMQVRDVLSDATNIDVDAASAAVGYPLGWHHLALIVWYGGNKPEGDELARLQRFADELAVTASTSAGTLFAAADRTSAWVWLPYRFAPGDIVTKVRDFADRRPDPLNVAAGAVGSGVAGFRRSHCQAQRVRAAMLARGSAQGAARQAAQQVSEQVSEGDVVAATDPDMMDVALLATSIGELREWVADVLGDLATDSDDDGRLRETLRIFLDTGSGFATAAEELNLNYNALKSHVKRAVARRGRPMDDGLDVSLALLVCDRYGAAVLRRTR